MLLTPQYCPQYHILRGWKLEFLTLPPLSSATVCIIWKPLPRVRRARRPLLLQENQAPEAIPPEAVKENMDVKDGLVGLAQPAMGEPSGEREEGRMEQHQGEIGIHLDPDTLSYVETLFSQEDLLNKVGWL